MPLDRAADPVFVHSTCPHDCPSTCALEVERLSATRIGKVRGAGGNDYTDGVVCAKVARYAERVHHPRSEEHTSELQSLMRISYAVFCLKKKKHTPTYIPQH